MIALSRVDLRRFRLAARRCVSPGRPRDMSLPIRITAEGDTVTLTAHLLDVVVALRVPAAKPGSGSVVLPLADVERFEGTGPDVVTLGPIGPKKVTIAWDEGTHQRSAEFDIITTNREWPEQPEHLISLPPTFPQALHEAGRTAARESGKYAVEGVQIKGKAGQVIATDGKQALIQGGYTFPFTEDLLIPAVPFFGAKEVGEERAVSIGRSDKWLFLVIGPWQVWLAIDPEGRFPDVSGAVPRASGTRVNFTDQDAEVVLQALPRLPKEEGPEVQIVTLDLGRQVAIRASAGKEGEVVEVPLPGTECVGPAMLLVLNRVHLGRALAMGFREFRFASAERPMCTWDGPRMYLSAVLDPQCAIPRKTAPAGEDMPRAVPDRPLRPLRPNRSIPDSPERNSTMPARESPSPERNGHPEANGEALDPLAEAESLRVVLAEAHVRAGRLVTALRGFRKQHKTVTSALASLRSLRLE
jgi:hypothetical protein